MLRRVVTFIVLLPVYLYRYGVSPLLGPRCRFQPTCSEYAVEAVRAHGPWAGLWLSLKRLSHCHPIEKLGAGHGFDPVPVEISRSPWYAPWRVKSADMELTKK
ncbi:MAG: membrane protein insertion efficiency factor YidD [Parvibaculales bacterium]